jgi:hypothetical protein
MVDTNLVGNLTGETPGLINIPNHVGYKQDFHFAYGLDGAVGDSSWMENGPKVPFAVVGTVTHPTTPYGIDPITGEINCDLPVYAGAGTGSFVVNIGGSICMISKANALGYNDPLNTVTYDDPVSVAVRGNANNFGEEHIWAINLPGPQSGPWEYWDPVFWDQVPHPLGGGASVHDVALATNPDMSMEKANRYIDTSLWFFAPRAFVALKLDEWSCSTSTGIFNPVVASLQVSPNPASDMVYFQNTVGATRIQLVNMLGQTVMSHNIAGQDIVSLFVSDLQTGIYLVGAYDNTGKLLGNARIMKN